MVNGTHDHHNRPAGAQAPARYPGPTIDAATLVSGSELVSDQAIADALYLQRHFGSAAYATVLVGAGRNTVINVGNNATANAWGNWAYDESAHPPSDRVRDAVAAYAKWASENLHKHARD